MDKLLYVSMTGARESAIAQSIHAHNLANVNTTGFRADFADARAMQLFGETHPSRVYAMSEKPASNFDTGTLVETGNPLDLAIDGEGWFAVVGPDGEEAYTRASDMFIDGTGLLRTGAGYMVLGDAGPVSLPPLESILVGNDGTISIQGKGQPPEALVQVARLRLVNPDKAQLSKSPDGLFRSEQRVDDDPAVRLHSGFLESSNVNAVDSLTNIMALSRQFELQIKMMHAAEENSESASRIMQLR